MTRDVEIDRVLAEERAAPGADRRFGVSIVAFPPASVRAYIGAVQDALRGAEPQQYFYPADDLHLTVVELLSDVTPDVAAAARVALDRAEPDVWRDLPVAVLQTPEVRTDPRAAFAVFAHADGLAELRRELERRLTSAGVPVIPRYQSTFAHLTFFRYVDPPAATDTEWSDTLAAAARVPAPAPWTLDALWVVHGVTWYGRPDRVTRDGPFPLTGPS